MDDNHHICLKEKPLHWQALSPTRGDSHQWFHHAQLCPETEAALCTAQEQIMVTNFIRKEIFKQN
eukprot:13535484-Ditylum_brightwellii.AAC.1